MAEKKGLLTNKVIRKAYISWMLWPYSLLNSERQCGESFMKMFNDVRDDLYPNQPEKQKELLKRHSNFFNTNAELGCVVPAVVLGMEAEKAQGGDIPDELITSVKQALGGPFAGLGDSLVAGTLCPILLGIALGLSQNGEITGPLFYLVTFSLIMYPLTWFLFKNGASLGLTAAEKVLSGGLKDRITKALDIVGLCIIGAITAQYTNVNIGFTYTSGDLAINVGSMIESILPGLTKLIAFLTVFFLMKKKNVSTVKMILIIAVVAVVGYFTTILV